MPRSSARTQAEPAPSPVAVACANADALLRAAAECARQHERMGRCLELGCSDAELLRIVDLANLTDRHLDDTVAEYEAAATDAPEAKDEGWWHAANALWLAGRELRRRNRGVDYASRFVGKHAKEKLAELTMEFELERSAVIALKQAINGYRAVRPGAEG
jgi:hypothetical protein